MHHKYRLFTRKKHRICGLYLFSFSIIFSDNQLYQLSLVLQACSVLNLDLRNALYSRACFLPLMHCLSVVLIEFLGYSVMLYILVGITSNISHDGKALSLFIFQPYKLYESLIWSLNVLRYIMNIQTNFGEALCAGIISQLLQLMLTRLLYSLEL